MGQQVSYFPSENAETTYQKYRKLASEQAQLRNDCFEQSQIAYKSRRGKEAKELSQRGKEHTKKMEQYNMKAVEVIFKGINYFLINIELNSFLKIFLHFFIFFRK